jgi:hypothetical protein
MLVSKDPPSQPLGKDALAVIASPRNAIVNKCLFIFVFLLSTFRDYGSKGMGKDAWPPTGPSPGMVTATRLNPPASRRMKGVRYVSGMMGQRPKKDDKAIFILVTPIAVSVTEILFSIRIFRIIILLIISLSLRVLFGRILQNSAILLGASLATSPECLQS